MKRDRLAPRVDIILSRVKKSLVLLLVLVVVGVFYWPTLRWLGNAWLSNDYYSHGFLVPIVAGFFAWQNRKALVGSEPSITGVFALSVAAILYVFGIVRDERLLTGLSLIVLVGGIVLSIWGLRRGRVMAFPIFFLLFMIPFPFVQDLGFTLQGVSVESSAWLLRLFGMSVDVVGRELHLGDLAFTVGLPCSGINTLIALLALTAVYTYLLAGSWRRRAFLFILAFPIAIAANILRVTSIVLVARFGNVDVATGVYHDVSSPLFFALAFLCIVLLARLMKCKLGFGVPGQE